jgi:cytoskeletal protein RodZ
MVIAVIIAIIVGLWWWKSSLFLIKAPTNSTPTPQVSNPPESTPLPTGNATGAGSVGGIKTGY